MEDHVADFYRTDEYIRQNPSLHEEDSPWKVTKIIPLVDRFIDCNNKGHITVMDVGGGAGLILSEISSYIEDKHKINVDKYALDLSPGMLEIQKQRNPQLKRALNEDICCTTLRDKEIDLVLLIDLLEHVPNTAKALEEVKRISSYAIFKVPLGGWLIYTLWNQISGGKPRRYVIEKYGHVNIYTYSELRGQIQEHTGQILCACFTNFHEYYFSHTFTGIKGTLLNLMHIAGTLTFKFSPRLAAFMFGDFAMLLVKCY